MTQALVEMLLDGVTQVLTSRNTGDLSAVLTTLLFVEPQCRQNFTRRLSSAHGEAHHNLLFVNLETQNLCSILCICTTPKRFQQRCIILCIGTGGQRACVFVADRNVRSIVSPKLTSHG
jgi:hypothetical protein